MRRYVIVRRDGMVEEIDVDCLRARSLNSRHTNRGKVARFMRDMNSMRVEDPISTGEYIFLRGLEEVEPVHRTTRWRGPQAFDMAPLRDRGIPEEQLPEFGHSVVLLNQYLEGCSCCHL